MLILTEKHGDTNFLHIIIGPETEMQFNLQGHSAMDITEVISSLKPGEKFTVVINRCDSEEDAINMIEMQRSKQNMMNIMNQVQKKMSEQTTNGNQEKPESTKKENTQSSVRCPICLRENSAIIKDGMVHPCSTCQKIEDGLRKGKIPPPLDNDTLDGLRRDVESVNPNQKKTNFKYYSKDNNKKGKK